jgi:hypothetical protein
VWGVDIDCKRFSSMRVRWRGAGVRNILEQPVKVDKTSFDSRILWTSGQRTWGTSLHGGGSWLVSSGVRNPQVAFESDAIVF